MILPSSIKHVSLTLLPAVMVVAFATLITPVPAVAQVHFEVPLKVSDGVDSTILYFGMLSGANFCIVESDSFHGHAEFFLPPVPPAGIFDSRFKYPRTGSGGPACFDQGSPCDFRPFTSTAQRDTIKVVSQVGSGAGIIITWPDNLASRFTQLSLRYFDENLGQIDTVNMLTATMADLGNPSNPPTATIFSGGLIIPVEPPPAPVLVSPPNGATGQPVPVTLRWNVSSSALTYRVQVSTDSNFTTTAFDDSTLTDTTRSVSVQFGTQYYWHVRAKNTGGVSAYSSRFTFTTQFQPPPAPTLVSPSNGQVNTPTTLPLLWNPISGALTYRLQVATTSNFAQGTIVLDSSLTATSDMVGPLLTGTQYFWHVNATNPGGPGPYSSVWNFTTVPAPPAAPVLQSPADGSTGVSLIPVLTWNAAATATLYHLQVSLDSLFGSFVVNDSTISGTSRQIGQLLGGTRHFWRVSARNAGGIGPFSSVFRFTTTLAPPAPVLVLPADSAIRLPSTPTFVWTRVNAATTYRLQIATDTSFSGLVVNDSTIADTSNTVAPLPWGARLFWRVRSMNSSGSSEPTRPRMFTVMLQPPGLPAQVAPANNMMDAPVTITLRWTRVPLAQGYEVPIAFDTLMTNLFSDTTVTDTFAVVNVLASTANYWRVRAYNTEHSFGPWTSVRRFTTGNFPPAIPTPLSPLSGDTGVVRTPTFRWTGVPGALTYRVQVSTNIGFPPSSILADDSILTGTAFSGVLLPPRTSCFWRVRSRGTAGSSAYSAVQGFNTGTATDVPQTADQEIPSGFRLLQNYPNPFNPSTTIPFEIASQAFVTMKVYDLLGREIRTLVDEHMSAGSHWILWDGRGESGVAMPSGIYFVRLTAAAPTGNPFRASQKLLLLK